jgi:hypothetical protein
MNGQCRRQPILGDKAIATAVGTLAVLRFSNFDSAPDNTINYGASAIIHTLYPAHRTPNSRRASAQRLARMQGEQIRIC